MFPISFTKGLSDRQWLNIRTADEKLLQSGKIYWKEINLSLNL